MKISESFEARAEKSRRPSWLGCPARALCSLFSTQPASITYSNVCTRSWCIVGHLAACMASIASHGDGVRSSGRRDSTRPRANARDGALSVWSCKRNDEIIYVFISVAGRSRKKWPRQVFIRAEFSFSNRNLRQMCAITTVANCCNRAAGCGINSLSKTRFLCLLYFRW